MIFYFTGTGNSSYVAKSISEYNNDRMICISEEMKKDKNTLDYHLGEDETIGFVYPVYAWAPPKQVLDFISSLRLNNYNNNYIFSVSTCGDNIGNTMDVLQKSLKRKGLILNSGFSIIMPNNYIILGDVDSKELEGEKLLKAEDRLKVINEIVKERKKDVFQLKKGSFPTILTSVINPMFNTFALNPKKFYVTDKCTGCGLCEKVCTARNISVNKKPTWGPNCTQCLACIHQCPTRAIEYGKGTIKKGRYKNPNMK
ncbi:EFR1 family ferrodoxin [uncultured Clostridium sp.]|uniref:EFR1 family ferrodoxin n=1 Tax=uncultured Clostridium sp. TaxID=59620 RepID=UPI0028E9CE2A|nr:EFR1 family ferrodoxin [uncultured Clostridium sp.]